MPPPTLLFLSHPDFSAPSAPSRHPYTPSHVLLMPLATFFLLAQHAHLLHRCPRSAHSGLLSFLALAYPMKLSVYTLSFLPDCHPFTEMTLNVSLEPSSAPARADGLQGKAPLGLTNEKASCLLFYS